MPPKKKKGKKKKKKDDGVLTTEDKYKKTQAEIEALKDHLAIRKEFARRSQTASEEWKYRMKEAENDLRDHESLQREVSADMTRQYKTMQTDLELKNHNLKSQLAETKAELEKTQEELKQTQQEKEKLCSEKDMEIADLRLKIDTMALQYEQVLNNTLDRLMEKISKARDKWEEDTTLIQHKNKQALLDFGLMPLHL